MIKARDDEVPHGAYGLTITGLRAGPASVGLIPVPPGASWPSLEVRARVGTASRPAAHALDDERAVILLVEGEYVEIDRRLATATIHTTKPLDEHDIVHPYLASPAGVFAQWNGRLAIHAGGALIDGGAWAVLGDKAAGKTTLLAELHHHGFGVVADDMIILGDGMACAGPRCLDLRPEAAAHLTRGCGTVLVRDGGRVRLPLPGIPAMAPFRGWIVLQDADMVATRPIPMRDRVPYLSSQLMMGTRAPHAGLDLLAHPMLALRRPRAWEALGPAVDALVAAVTREDARAH